MYLYVSCPSAKRAIKGLHGCRKMNFTVRAHGREAQNLNMLSKQLPRGDSKRNTLLLQSRGGALAPVATPVPTPMGCQSPIALPAIEPFEESVRGHLQKDGRRRGC